MKPYPVYVKFNDYAKEYVYSCRLPLPPKEGDRVFVVVSNRVKIVTVCRSEPEKPIPAIARKWVLGRVDTDWFINQEKKYQKEFQNESV